MVFLFVGDPVSSAGPIPRVYLLNWRRLIKNPGIASGMSGQIKANTRYGDYLIGDFCVIIQLLSVA